MMSLRMTVNPNIIEMEYAVRGPIPQRAAELKRQGIPIISCNIGNPQALGQKPISFYRQVLGLMEEPDRIGRERRLSRLFQGNRKVFDGLTDDDFVSDYVLDLCDDMISKLATGMGAYTESKGPYFIREAVAQYIDARDAPAPSGGVGSDPESIFLTNGASEGAKHIIDILVADPTDGIMIPIPQYPLYSAAIRKAGGVQVNYYPDEDNGWTLDKSILEESFTEATRRGVTVKAIVVINPANPTGAVLPEQSARDVIDFAQRHHLAIIADEV